jgi:hypothetical protein
VTDWNDPAFADPDMLLAGLVAEIEGAKGSVRIEYDNFKDAYHRSGKLPGHTKRQTEDRLARLSGEVLGYESELGVLYRATAARDEKKEE